MYLLLPPFFMGVNQKMTKRIRYPLSFKRRPILKGFIFHRANKKSLKLFPFCENSRKHGEEPMYLKDHVQVTPIFTLALFSLETILGTCANIIDPAQMWQNDASDKGLHRFFT